MTDFSFGQHIQHLPISPRDVWRHVEALGYWLNSAASRYGQPIYAQWSTAEANEWWDLYLKSNLDLDDISLGSQSWIVVVAQNNFRLVVTLDQTMRTSNSATALRLFATKTPCSDNKITPAHSKPWFFHARACTSPLRASFALSRLPQSSREACIAPTSHNYPIGYNGYTGTLQQYQPPQNRGLLVCYATANREIVGSYMFAVAQKKGVFPSGCSSNNPNYATTTIRGNS